MSNIIKKEKYTIAISVLTYMVSLLICVAMFLPRNIGNIYKVTDSPTAAFGVADIKAQINCSVQSSGEYKIEDSDPQLLFSVGGQEIGVVKLNISSPVEKAVSFEIYTSFEDCSFSAERCYVGSVLKGETACVISVPKGEYYFLRVDIDDDGICFKNIEIYDEQPETVPFNFEYSFFDYIFAITIPIVSAVIMWFVDRRFKICERFVRRLKHNKLKIAEYVVFIIVAVLLGILIELIVGLVSQESTFNIYRCIFFIGIPAIVFAFCLEFKNLSDRPEKVFLPITLILGFVMLFGSPIKHICWDLDSHYPWAVCMSYSDTAYLTAADLCIDKAASQSVVASDFDLDSYKDDLAYLNEADNMLVREADARFSIAHLPAGIFIAIARYFGASFAVKYNFGRISYLLIYTFVCYFAIKKLKSGKMILSTICLFPTCLFMATNYAYDYWVIAFSILGVSYYTSMLQEPEKKITVWDTVVMCGSFALAALPKLIYIILMGIPFFMFKKWNSKREKGRYYLILMIIFAVVFASFMLKSLTTIGGTGDSRGGAVSPSGQISFIFSDIIGYAKILIKFLTQYLSVGAMKQYTSNFAYLGIGTLWPIFVVMIVFTALTDSNDHVKFKIPIIIKICSVILFIGLAALIATALYIDFTPVGYNTVLGCQPRYIIPLLPPLLLLVTGQRWNLIKNKSVYNGVVLTVLSATVMIETYSQIITKMV